MPTHAEDRIEPQKSVSWLVFSGVSVYMTQLQPTLFVSYREIIKTRDVTTLNYINVYSIIDF